MKFQLLICFIFILFSCDQEEVDCISCHSSRLSQTVDGGCICDSAHYQFGLLRDATCETVNQNSHLKCVKIQGETYLVYSDRDCPCSPYTDNDTAAVRFLGLGIGPRVTSLNSWNLALHDSGALREYRVVDGVIHFQIASINQTGYSYEPDLVTGCQDLNYLGTMNGSIDQATRKGRATILWYKDIFDQEVERAIDSSIVIIDGSR